MRRISTATRVPNKFGPGKDGFTNGDAVGGIPATDLEDNWFDSVQEEIANAVEASGQTLDPNDRTQLTKAMRGRLLRTSVYTNSAGTQLVSVDGAAATSTGATTFAPLSGTAYVDVEAVGGGGAGGGAATTGASQTSVGAGGGAGAYARGRFSSASAAGAVVTVGAGGAGVAGAGGNGGGTTSFGSLLTCPGGSGGQRLGPSAAPLYASSGVSLSSTGGYIVGSGAAGEIHFGFDNNNAFGGNGGTSYFGGGAARSGGATGGAGVSPGSGGGGTVTPPSNGQRTGGAGAPGVLIVREYA
jgi:hypothetical protein